MSSIRAIRSASCSALLFFALVLVAGPSLAAGVPAAPGAAPEAPATQLEEPTPADGCASEADLTGGLTPAPVETACYDLTCEWRDDCFEDGYGGKTDYKKEYCFTNCGYYWYFTGNTCCYRSSPGSC